MNYYEELGLKKEATTNEIKRAYRQLAKKYHPDKNPDDEQATGRFVRIAVAYEILSDEQKRQEYDAQWDGQGRRQSANSRTQATSTAHVNPMNMGEFENFFGFTTKGDTVVPTNKTGKDVKKNPMDTSQMFEKFFGK